jgi:broad specificity phosphatase PhoE
MEWRPLCAGIVGGVVGGLSVALAYHYWTQPVRWPRRIILVRHGESEGNVNDSAYVQTPDNLISLTDLGRQQARDAGKEIKAIVGKESVIFYCSPFLRAKQTYREILQGGSFGENVKGYKEEPRLRELEFGYLQDPDIMRESWHQRSIVGRFFYRFNGGESAADVYDRVTAFLETLHRSFCNTSHRHDNIVLVSHGLTLRLFLMRYFKWPVAVFERTHNFSNAEICVLECFYKQDGKQAYRVCLAPKFMTDEPALKLTEHGFPRNEYDDTS